MEKVVDEAGTHPRVAHVVFSSSGGAGVVARRMVNWQQTAGYSSRLVNAIDGGVGVGTMSRPLLLASSLSDFFIVRKNLSASLFTLFRSSTGRKSDAFGRREIAHLHWTPGVLGLWDLEEMLRRRVSCVWTLHDMWPFTGGCHHNEGCRRFEEDCSGCPQVRSVFRSAVTNRLQAKQRIMGSAPTLRVVSPSKWLRDEAQRSSVLRDVAVDVIPNPVAGDFFTSHNPRSVAHGRSTIHLCFVATNLSDQNKNLDKVIAVISGINSDPSSRIEVRLHLIGGKAPARLGSWVVDHGTVSGSSELARTISKMDFLVSYSTSENLPNVIAEAMACGVPVVARNIGGVPEMVRHGENGFLVEGLEDLAGAIRTICGNPLLTAQMSIAAREWAERTVSEDRVMDRYRQVYESLEPRGK